MAKDPVALQHKKEFEQRIRAEKSQKDNSGEKLLFSLSPLSPEAYTRDPANPDAPSAWAILSTFGGVTSSGSKSLGEQHKNNEILLALNAVEDGDTKIARLEHDFYQRCTISIWVWPRHVSPTSALRFF